MYSASSVGKEGGARVLGVGGTGTRAQGTSEGICQGIEVLKLG